MEAVMPSIKNLQMILNFFERKEFVRSKSELWFYMQENVIIRSPDGYFEFTEKLNNLKKSAEVNASGAGFFFSPSFLIRICRSIIRKGKCHIIFLN